MTKEELLRKRVAELVTQADTMTSGARYIFANKADERHHWRTLQAKAGAWLASASALAEALLPNPVAPHRRFIQHKVANGAHGEFEDQVRSVAGILVALLNDIDHGLFKSIADNATAMAFDDLLDHADDYLEHHRIDVAGVIAGVAFEDSMRRARAARNIQPDDIAIETLIVELTRVGVLSAIESKRARAASALRTSATHARWEEFSQQDVEACIHFTRQFIEKMFAS